MKKKIKPRKCNTNAVRVNTEKMYCKIFGKTVRKNQDNQTRHYDPDINNIS